MPNILEVEMRVTDIKDTMTTIKSDTDTKVKDNEQIRTITAKRGDTVNGTLKIVISGAPQLLQGFALNEIKLKINDDQTELQTGVHDD